MTTSLLVSEADHKIRLIETRAVDVAFAVREEAYAVEQRDTLLRELTDSLIGQPDPSKKQKADGTYPEHSATSAEKAAKSTEQYQAAKRAALDAECKRITAWADYEIAKLQAKLAVVAAADGDL